MSSAPETPPPLAAELFQEAPPLSDAGVGEVPPLSAADDLGEHPPRGTLKIKFRDWVAHVMDGYDVEEEDDEASA